MFKATTRDRLPRGGVRAKAMRIVAAGRASIHGLLGAFSPNDDALESNSGEAHPWTAG